MRLNKKGQAGTATWALWLGELLGSAFLVIGLLQVVFFAFQQSLENLVSTVFGGNTLLLFFVACGLIGMSVNEAIYRYYARAPFGRRIPSFFIAGIVCIVVGGLITHFAPTQAQAMLLP